MNDNEKQLHILYSKIENDIVKQIDRFNAIYISENEEEIFSEMMFCLLTPQSKAKVCWSCIDELLSKEDIRRINKKQLKTYIKPVRFYNNKTEYIYELIKKTNGGLMGIRDILYSGKNDIMMRDELVKYVKGYGFKEASHFMRNVGLGEDIAILDRHILKNLLLFEIIDHIPESLSRKRYIDIENRMRIFANKQHIPLAHMDILLWYKETGEIFK